MEEEKMLENLDDESLMELLFELEKLDEACTKLTDEVIREAYAALYFELGRFPTEKETIQKTGAAVDNIRGRNVWKEDKNKWIEMYRDVYGVQKNVQDVQNECTDIHLYTPEDF